MGSLRSSIMNKEEELTLFLEMKKRQREKEKERNNHHLFVHNSNEFDTTTLVSKTSHNHLQMVNNSTHTTVHQNATHEFLNAQNIRNDYDWLMTPPETPLFASREPESQTNAINLPVPEKDQSPEPKSKLAKPQEKHTTKTNSSSIKSSSSNGLNTSTITGSHRSSSSVGSTTRPITPTRHPPLNISYRSTPPSVPKQTLNTSPRVPSPKSRSIIPSPKATVPPKASNPISSSTSRSLTPTKTQTTPPSRARTPTRGPTVVTTTTPKNPPPGRSTSPVVKPRPLKPTDIPGFSVNVPPNLRTSLPDRLISANRGRPGVPSIRSSSVEPLPKGKVRRQSCSPDRGGNKSAAIRSSASSVPALNRLHAKANDNVSPAMVGTKMVERLINMRKLVPPKPDNNKLSSTGKSSAEGSGFGRTLSKKSLDMAIRHMDIKGSISGNLRPLMSNIPASSIYSVRSGSLRSKNISMSESPIAARQAKKPI